MPKSAWLWATSGGKQGTWQDAAATGIHWKVWKQLLQRDLAQHQPHAPTSAPRSNINPTLNHQPHTQRPFHCWFLTFNRSGEGLPSGSKVMLVSEPHATSLKLTNSVRGTISTT